MKKKITIKIGKKGTIVDMHGFQGTVCIEEFEKIKTMIADLKIEEQSHDDKPELYQIETQEQTEELTY